MSSSLTLPQKYKIMNKVKGYLIVALFWITVILLLSSCQTVKEITMSDSKVMTQCNWVNNR